MILNATQFAKLAGVSRQTISKQCIAGVLLRRPDGMLDTTSPVNVDYLRKRKEISQPETVVDKPDKPPKIQDKSYKKQKKPRKRKEKPKSVQPIEHQPLDLSGDIEDLAPYQLSKLKELEQIKKLQLEREIKRNLYVDKKIVQTLFSKLYEIHMNEFLTVKDKLTPDLSSIFGSTDQQEISEAGAKIDEILWKCLDHIKHEFDRFLNELKANEL